MPRAIAEVSADTIKLEGILSALKVGESCSYDTLSAAVQRDVQRAGRGVFSSARRRLFRERQMVFSCVPGEGVKRIGDVEMIAHGTAVLQRVRRASKRGMAVVLAVEDFGALSADMKLKHNATAVVLGSIAVLSGKPGQRKLTAKIAQAHALTVGEILAIAESI